MPRFPAFWFNPFPTQSVRLLLVTYPSVCSPYVACRTPCHAIGHQQLPTQPFPRKAGCFPRGGKHSKHVPLLTYLGWLQPVNNNSGLILKYVKTQNELLVKKTLIKKSTLISSHFNQLFIAVTSFSSLPKVFIKNCSLKKYISELLS